MKKPKEVPEEDNREAEEAVPRYCNYPWRTLQRVHRKKLKMLQRIEKPQRRTL